VKYFNFIAAVLLSLLYATGKIPPSEKYNLWFTTFIIPGAMVLNTLLLIAALLLRKKSSLYYLIPMFIGLPYVMSTVGIKRYFKRHPDGSSFTVLNYNVANLQIKQPTALNIDSARMGLRQMILNPLTDIQCYQEFVNYPWSKNFNIIDQLQKENKHFYFSMEDETTHMEYSRVGTLIVSKFPIASHGDILASQNGFNRVSYVDVVIGKDTLRVINVHLESMGLSQYDPRYKKNLTDVKNSTRTILSKLKFGVFERSKQIKEVANFVQLSPHPVICAGDFNDMPYSYSYQYLKRSMKNTFEEAGAGLGFTYNGDMLRMLRIDNQFYAGAISALDLQTRYDLNGTDHFPIVGTYKFISRRQ